MIEAILIGSAAISAQAAFTAWLIKMAEPSRQKRSVHPPEYFGDWRHPESWWAENQPDVRNAALEKERESKRKEHHDPVSFGYEGKAQQKYSGSSSSLGGSFQAWKPKETPTDAEKRHAQPEEEIEGL